MDHLTFQSSLDHTAPYDQNNNNYIQVIPASYSDSNDEDATDYSHIEGPFFPENITNQQGSSSGNDETYENQYVERPKRLSIENVGSSSGSIEYSHRFSSGKTEERYKITKISSDIAPSRPK